MNSNTIPNNQQTDEQMNNTTDQQKEEKNTVTTNRDEEEDDDDDDDDEKVEETNAEEEKINTNSENEDAEEENDESESEAGGQEQEDVGDDEGEDESVSDKAEEEEEDEEKVGNSPLPVDKTVQKSNSTSSEEDSHSESEYKPLPKPAVNRPARTSEQNEDAEEENDESESEAGGQEQEDVEDDEGEDESVSDKAEEEEDDEDEGKVGNSPLPVDKTVQKSNSTSCEEDSHSESESESECKSDCRSSKPLPKPAVKRPAETSEQNDIPERQRKKRKVDNGSQGMEEKKSVFSRFWSEEDEIALLMGMVQYKSSNGGDAYTDMGAFYEYIKNYLHVVPLRKQLTDKMGRLKRKYSKNAGKGKNPFFSKPHEREIFELSKKIWGGVEVAAATRTSGGVKASGENFLCMYPRLNESLQWVNHGLSESGRKLLEEGMKLIGSAKAEKMEEKWRNLQIHEMELYLKHVDLIHQQTKIVLDEMKSGNF